VTLSATFAYLILIPLTILALIQPSHLKMQELKYSSMRIVNEKISQNLELVNCNGFENYKNEEVLRKVDENMSLFETVSNNHTWPIRMKNIFALFIQYLMPVLLVPIFSSIISNYLIRKNE